jgi:glycyl-tRNA synthetase alpha chain
MSKSAPGTMCPETFLRVLGPKPYRVAYVQPSRRPGRRPLRREPQPPLQAPAVAGDPEALSGRHHRAVPRPAWKPSASICRKHDIKFEEDNWESPTLGAWGIGWQVMLDGLEITQFTYFQQCGGIDLDLVPAELTYGLERLVAFLQGKDSVYDIEWAPGVTYGDVRSLTNCSSRSTTSRWPMSTCCGSSSSCTRRSAAADRRIPESPGEEALSRCCPPTTRC